MKKLMLVLATTLLAASTAHPDTGAPARYRGLPERISLTVNHDIHVEAAGAEPIATREFSFELTQASSRDATIDVTIDRATGSYTVHGGKQRLGTRHITGKKFSLAIADGGRRLEHTDSFTAAIDVGPPVEEGFSIVSLLNDTLPALPDKPLSVGTTWTSERPVRSLEGWAWGSGKSTSHHRVIAVDRREDHDVVSVTTEATASLGGADGKRAFTGTMKRTLRWTFDTTDGRLLTLSMDQESTGSCPLQQGDVELVQKTRVELSALDATAAP